MVCACPERDQARRALHRNQMCKRRRLPLLCLMMPPKPDLYGGIPHEAGKDLDFGEKVKS